MKRKIQRLIGKIIGQRLKYFYLDYCVVPRLLFMELRRILTMIRYKRLYNDDPEVWLSRLRTDAHIVDKGLQVDDWEEGHSQTLYVQLCNEIERMKGSSFETDPSYQWAIQKKIEYEQAYKSGKIDVHFMKNNDQDGHQIISKDDFLHLIRSRRTIRTFDDRPVATEILKDLADVMNWSPTSCNRQPAKLFITQNPEKVDICLKQCAGATCIGDIRPCFIAVCADTRFYMIKDRNLSFIDVSLGLQNMLLMAHAQGIGATILNWMHHTPKEDSILRELLGIPEYYSIVINLIIGYYTKSPPVPGRKGIDLSYRIIN